MAKQVGDIGIVGTIDDITFYKMEGQYYARKKSRLTGKRVKKDPKFTRTMQSARRLGRGSQLASKVYRSLPRTEQVYALYKELKSLAVLALKEGRPEAEVMELLQYRVSRTHVRKQRRIAIAEVAMPYQSGRVQKPPRLFKVYGGRLKEVNEQGIKDGQRKMLLASYPQRE